MTSRELDQHSKIPTTKRRAISSVKRAKNRGKKALSFLHKGIINNSIILELVTNQGCYNQMNVIHDDNDADDVDDETYVHLLLQKPITRVLCVHDTLGYTVQLFVYCGIVALYLRCCLVSGFAASRCYPISLIFLLNSAGCGFQVWYQMVHLQSLQLLKWKMHCHWRDCQVGVQC